MIIINTIFSSIVFLNKNVQWDRENGPAYIHDNHKQWYQNGKLHRLDGPAYIHDNHKQWYINGIEYSETEYHNKLKEMGIL